MTVLLAGIEGGSCTTARLAGREERSYTMTALLARAGIEGDSCKTAQLPLPGREVLAEREGRSYTMTALLAGIDGNS
jgi:glycerol-3-phosphate dehydrogenase